MYESCGTKRFSELRALIPSITQKVLTNQLRELEEKHIVRRVVYPQVPPKVEYSVTEMPKKVVHEGCLFGRSFFHNG
ncbi:winged helix-turn-helix transcriptional regulator [Paenibacillus paeoniae]|uniref:HTH hxlR-type domain-containing protein n=1 Tax=Paenibacillus paeoniae TaxID=2292705 RepID=A0A371P7S5_9BACL|nr:hypothetical protein DX130_19965 [Paenibacillus paeoniae]